MACGSYEIKWVKLRMPISKHCTFSRHGRCFGHMLCNCLESISIIKVLVFSSEPTNLNGNVWHIVVTLSKVWLVKTYIYVFDQAKFVGMHWICHIVRVTKQRLVIEVYEWYTLIGAWAQHPPNLSSNLSCIVYT